jgi:hypothetical protein
MTVKIRYLLSFLPEMDDACKMADAAGDKDGWPALKRLWFDYLQARLGRMTGTELISYLGNVGSWHTYGEWTVFKTIDEPSMAFTAQAAPNGETTLICLGVCYRYPNGSAEEWWNKILLPRLEKLK